MNYKIAVASRDGKFINEHFGRAERFLIFDLETGNYIEERKNEKICQNGEHESSAFDRTSELLSDCKAIVISKIGFGASSYMESKGFDLFEAGMPISDAVEKLQKYYAEGGKAYVDNI